MIQRGGEVVIRMLANVQQVTIGPLIERTIAKELDGCDRRMMSAGIEAAEPSCQEGPSPKPNPAGPP